MRTKHPPIRDKTSFFKIKKWLSDKKSDISYTFRKIKNCFFITFIRERSVRTFNRLKKNFKENKENWNERVNVDENFQIDV